MKFTSLLMLFLMLSVQADYVKKTIGVCKDEKSLPGLEEYAAAHALEQGGLDLELLLIKYDCMIIDNKTKIEVLDYTGEKKGILKLVLKETGEIYFATNKGIQIEQPGQNNIIYKF